MTEVKETATALRPGHMVQQYRIDGPLGRGGQAVVWKATDTKLDREVALKQVPPGPASDPEYVEAFRREVRTLARIGPKCPHIVSVFDYLEDPAGLFSVIEYVPGDTLEALIASDAMDDRKKFHILGQLLTALAEVHAHGVLHRDVKPANVLVETRAASMWGAAEPEVHVRLTDFGLSGAAGGPNPRMGTTKYMAPESFGKSGADARADLYAAGFTAYEMFAGRAFAKAFEDILADTRNQHLRWMQWHTGPKQAPTLAELRPDVPQMALLSPIVARLMSKDLGRRYGSAAEALADLRALAGGAAPAPAPVAVAPVAVAPAAPVAGIPAIPSIPPRPGSAVMTPVPAAPVPAAPAPLPISPARPAAAHGAVVPAAPAAVVAAPAPRAGPEPRMPGGGGAPSFAVSKPPEAIELTVGGQPGDTRRLPETPFWQKPASLAVAGGLVLCVTLIFLSLGRTDPVRQIRGECAQAFARQDWPKVAETHRRLADALRGTVPEGSETPAELARQIQFAEAAAELSAAKAESGKPSELLSVALRTRDVFKGLGTATAKEWEKLAAEIVEQAGPEQRFADGLRKFLEVMGRRELAASRNALAAMEKIDQDFKLGKVGVVRSCRNVLEAFEGLERNRSDLMRLADGLKGAPSYEENEKLAVCKEEFRRAVSKFDTALTGQVSELSALKPQLDAARLEAQDHERHAQDLLDFYRFVKNGQTLARDAKGSLSNPDSKSKPRVLFESTKLQFEKARDIAARMETRKQIGVTKVAADLVSENLQLCQEAFTFIDIQAAVSKSTTLGSKPVIEVKGLPDDALAKYKTQLEGIKFKSDLVGTEKILNAVDAEIAAREEKATAETRLKKWDELDVAVREAARAGKFDEEIRLRDQQRALKVDAKIRSWPKGTEERIVELQKALDLLPVLEAQAKELSDAAKEAEEAVRDPAKLVKFIPGQIPEVKVDELITRLDGVRTNADAVVPQAGRLTVFRSEVSLSNKLTAAERDLDVISKMVARLSETRGDMLRFQGFLKDAAAAKPNRKSAYWDDALNLSKGMQKPGTDGVALLRMRIGEELEKLVRYEKETVEIDKRIVFGENSLNGAASVANNTDKQRFLDSAKGHFETAADLCKTLPFPLDAVRKARLNEGRKKVGLMPLP
jgi:tRNA A-37 threonylcarbamoyl transferase component Bud32/tetratricopeptide (TPR) repeat protein